MAKIINFPTNRAKVEYSEGIYSVMVWSPVSACYISQGEWLSREEAELDRKMWSN